MVRFSVIIPVYNVSDYLAECIDSVLHQDFCDYEIILVNDGSTDNSGQICDSYENEYAHVVVVHQRNGGLSSARNTGLSRANGQFVLFIDADDYIAKGSLRRIEAVLQTDPDIDVVFLDAVKVFPDGSWEPLGDGYCKEAIYQKTHQEVLEHLASLPKFPGSACTKLVRIDLIRDHKIWFEDGLLSEDIDWTIRLLKKAQKYNYGHFAYYFYRQCRPGSITSSANLARVESLLSIIERWSDKSNLEDERFQMFVNRILCYEFVILLANLARLRNEERTKLAPRVRDHSWLLDFSTTPKTRAVKFVYRFLGLEMTSLLLKKYLELRKRRTD